MVPTLATDVDVHVLENGDGDPADTSCTKCGHACVSVCMCIKQQIKHIVRYCVPVINSTYSLSLIQMYSECIF